MNIVNIVFSVLGLAGFAALSNGAIIDQMEDDAVKNEIAMASKYAWVGMLCAVLAIICSGLGIYGGLKFKPVLVAIAGGYFVVQTIMGLISKDVVGAIMTALFAYPHYFFFQERNHDSAKLPHRKALVLLRLS